MLEAVSSGLSYAGTAAYAETHGHLAHRTDWPCRGRVGRGDPCRRPEPRVGNWSAACIAHARRLRATGPADPRVVLLRVPQSGQAQRRALARDVCRCARRRAQRRSGASRQQRRQPDRSPRHRRHRTADAQGRAAARRRVDRAHPLVDRSRGPSDAFGRARAGAVGSAARARSASDSSRALAVVVVNNRSIRRGVSRRAARHGARVSAGRALRASRVSRRLGSPPRARRAARLSRRSFTEKARGARRPPPRPRSKECQEVRRPLGFVLERPAAQRRRRHLLFRVGGPKEHYGLALLSARVESPVRSVRQQTDQPDARDRPRGVPRRRELARRDERGGHALDAGVAEHRAGFLGREPEVQRLPRQLRQQVEAQGCVLARRVLLARGAAPPLSL